MVMNGTSAPYIFLQFKEQLKKRIDYIDQTFREFEIFQPFSKKQRLFRLKLILKLLITNLNVNYIKRYVSIRKRLESTSFCILYKCYYFLFAEAPHPHLPPGATSQTPHFIPTRRFQVQLVFRYVRITQVKLKKQHKSNIETGIQTLLLFNLHTNYITFYPMLSNQKSLSG